MDVVNVASGSDSDPSTIVNVVLNDPIKDVVNLLNCRSCRKYMVPEEIMTCMCRLYCKKCVTNYCKCEHCGHTLTEDHRVVQLHQRLSGVIPHPCRNSSHGCPIEVTPRSTHEKSCPYTPILCKCCNTRIPHIKLTPHLNLHHPNKYMFNSKNLSVTRSKFINLQTSSGENVNATIHCTARGQSFWINLTRKHYKDDIIFSIDPICVDKNTMVIIRFDFNLNPYSFTDCIKYGVPEKSSLMINRQIADDWIAGRCKLDINICARSKRMASVTLEDDD